MSARRNRLGGRALALAALLLATASVGCVTSYAEHHAMRLPASRVAEMRSFAVVNREGDERNIEWDIRDVLLELGARAEAFEREPDDVSGYDGVITYIERYSWDMSPYCMQLTLYVRDTKTGWITAVGSSWRPSLERKTPAGHAKLLLTELLGAAP